MTSELARPVSTDSLSRRSFLVGSLAAAVLAATSGTPTLAAGTTPNFTTTRAISTTTARRTLGVNIKTGANTGVYRDEARVRNLLSELRIEHVRDALFEGRRDQWQSLNALSSRGVRVNVVPGAKPDGTRGTTERIIREIADNCAGAVESIEGANEWNLKNRPQWAAELRTAQARLFRSVRSMPAMSAVPVLAPSLGRRTGHKELGDLHDVCDLGNVHLYSGGFSPTRYMEEQLSAATIVSGDNPVFVTECGYHTALRHQSGHFPTSEEAAATLMPRLLMEYVLRRVPRVFVYELLDQGTSQVDHEQALGFVRADGSRKPHFHAMRRLTSLLDDRGSVQPGNLDYRLSGGDAGLRHVVMENSDGDYFLALWRDVEVWEPRELSPLPVPPMTITLAVPGQAHFSVYSPSRSESVVQRGSGNSISVGLTGDLKLVKIDLDSNVTAASGQRCYVDISADSYSLASGASTWLSGSVEDHASSAPIGDIAVRLIEVPVDGSGRNIAQRPRTVAGVTRTDTDGRWQMLVSPRATTQFQVEVQPQRGFSYARSRPTRPLVVTP